MKYIFTILFLVLAGRLTFAQAPSFSSDNFIQVMSNSHTEDQFISSDVTGLVAILATKGENVSWNLGARTFTKNTTNTSFPNLQPVTAGMPFLTDQNFSTATHYEKKVQANATEYSFYKINTDGFFFIGTADDSTNGKQGIVLLLTPAAQFAKFPMTYGTTWSTTSVVTGSLAAGQQGTWEQSGNCDAWGTLTTPSGTAKKNATTASEVALRVKNVQKFGATVGGQFYGSATYTTSFYGQGAHSMTITTDVNDVPSKVSYSAPAGSGGVLNFHDAKFTATISPNPTAGSAVKVRLIPDHDCTAEISVIDASGNTVQPAVSMHISEGQNTIPIDAKKYSAGTYFVRVNADGVSETRKLVITK